MPEPGLGKQPCNSRLELTGLRRKAGVIAIGIPRRGVLSPDPVGTPSRRVIGAGRVVVFRPPAGAGEIVDFEFHGVHSFEKYAPSADTNYAFTPVAVPDPNDFASAPPLSLGSGDLKNMRHEAFPGDSRPLRAANQRAQVTLLCEVRQGTQPWKLARLTDLSPSGFKLGWLPEYCLDKPIRIRIPGIQVLSAEIRWHEGKQIGCEFAAPLHVAVFEHIVRLA